MLRSVVIMSSASSVGDNSQIDAQADAASWSVIERHNCINGRETTVKPLCIMHYALFLSAPADGGRSTPGLMHFEIYAIRYYVIKTF